MDEHSKQLKQAKENLERIREEFKDDPKAISLFEHHAVLLVEILSQGSK
jgi:archaellum component FlaC